MTVQIALTRDTAADAVAIVRLLRTNEADMAMFILSTYADNNDAMQGLVASVAAVANALLSTIDGMGGNADAVLSRAAVAVASFDPSALPEE